MWTDVLLVFSLGGNRFAVFTLEGNQVERVHCESADQCCHRVLRRQINELFPVRPATHIFKECKERTNPTGESANIGFMTKLL